MTEIKQLFFNIFRNSCHNTFLDFKIADRQPYTYHFCFPPQFLSFVCPPPRRVDYASVENSTFVTVYDMAKSPGPFTSNNPHYDAEVWQVVG
jgi:hypothetical protein